MKIKMQLLSFLIFLSVFYSCNFGDTSKTRFIDSLNNRQTNKLTDEEILIYAKMHFDADKRDSGIGLGDIHAFLMDYDQDGNNDVLVFAKGGFIGGNGIISAFGLYKNTGQKVLFIDRELLSQEVIDTVTQSDGTIIANGYEWGGRDGHCCPSINLTYSITVVNNKIQLLPLTLNNIGDIENTEDSICYKNPPFKLDFFEYYDSSLGDAMGKYSTCNEWYEASRYIFMTGCSDPGKRIFDAVIKVNGKFIRLKPILDSMKNSVSWPIFWQGNAYRINFRHNQYMNIDTLEIIQWDQKKAFLIYGKYQDEWGV